MRLSSFLLIAFLLLFGSLRAQTTAVDSAATDTTIYSWADESPEFPGGESALMAYLKKNIQFQVVDSNGCMCTSFYVTWVVEKDGSVSHVERARPLPNSCCSEQYEQFLAIIRAMPRWQPAKLNGHAVRYQLMIPIKCLYPR